MKLKISTAAAISKEHYQKDNDEAKNNVEKPRKPKVNSSVKQHELKHRQGPLTKSIDK